MTITYETGDGLYINMTNRCTCACNFCVRTHDDKTTNTGIYGNLWLEREPTVDEIKESINSRDLSKYSEIVFCGYGEPTMRLDDMLEVCRYVRSVSDKPVRLNTNGLANLYYKKDVTPQFHGMFDVVSISLNTATAEEYNELCHPRFGIAAYDGLLDFAKKLTAYVPKVVLSIVDTTIPPDDVEICRRRAEEAGAHLRIREYID